MDFISILTNTYQHNFLTSLLLNDSFHAQVTDSIDHWDVTETRQGLLQ